ncbi:MAG: phosphoribosylaminoimidazolesuccinocarboxamide synthase [Thermomicrobiales bacterium]
MREIVVEDLPLFRRGKIRDTFRLGDDLLMVASDRISAFDVVLPTAIPRKGAVLTQLSRFWFEQTAAIVPNHLLTADVERFPLQLQHFASRLAGRSMIVKRAERIEIECVVRGYIAGSAWLEYQASGTVCGESMAPGLGQAQRLDHPIFTPAIKNDAGHDENISRQVLADRIGSELASQLEETSLRLFQAAAGLALRRGIIIADTKFEFGLIDGQLSVIDEMVTPDSSRFWDAETYKPGKDQPSFDKQYVRNWLIDVGWDKQPPGPDLPADVVAGTTRRYHEAYQRLTGSPLRNGSEAWQQ